MHLFNPAQALADRCQRSCVQHWIVAGFKNPPVSVIMPQAKQVAISLFQSICQSFNNLKTTSQVEDALVITKLISPYKGLVA